MRVRVGGDVREVGVEVCVEAGGGEVGLGVVGEALAVEGVFEVAHVEEELEEGGVVGTGGGGLVEGHCADACGG